MNIKSQSLADSKLSVYLENVSIIFERFVREGLKYNIFGELFDFVDGKFVLTLPRYDEDFKRDYDYVRNLFVGYSVNIFNEVEIYMTPIQFSRLVRVLFLSNPKLK